MVLVDIYVPSVNTTYDFQLMDSVAVKTVIEEIAEMVGQKEQCRIVGDVAELVLVDRRRQKVLDKGMTLYECGIQTGEQLMLV